MARIKQLADKDGELIYPVVDPTQLHFSGTEKQAVKGDGTIGIPQYVKQLEGNGRIASADIPHQYDNDQVHQRLDISSSSMTTGKPAGDGFINTYSWDNTGSYDTQVWIPNSNAINNGMPQIRFKNNASSWSSWYNILNNNPVNPNISNVMTLNSGYSFVGSYSDALIVGKLMSLTLVVKKDSGTFGSSQENIGTLNSGYRPAKTVNYGCRFASSEWSSNVAGYLYIGVDGATFVNSHTTGTSYVKINITYRLS